MQRYLVFYGEIEQRSEKFNFYLHIPHGRDFKIGYSFISNGVIQKYYEILRASKEERQTICLILYANRSAKEDVPPSKNLPLIAQSNANHVYHRVTKGELEKMARRAFLEALAQVRRAAHEGASFGERDPELQASSPSTTF